jgi:iron(III) transport system ATP-binding protein
MTSGLEVSGLTKRFGVTTAVDDVSLSIESGEICALLGPSGSGKTTLLRIIAGLETADRGRVRLGETTLCDVEAKISVPAERRSLGMVFQDGAVFPHLDVRRNVGFGLGRRAPSSVVDEALAMVGLAGFGDRRPATLSGGQLQRVALARALAPRPEMLLFDEPFSSLDVALKVQVRRDVHRLLIETGTTSLFVTHDQDEAFVMADRILIMSEGRMVQFGTPHEVYERPATAWVARFVGDANLLPGHATDGTVTTVLGRASSATPTAERCAEHGHVVALVRPERIVLGTIRSDSDGAAGTVELVEFHGHDQVAVVRLDTGDEIRVRFRDQFIHRHQRVVVRIDEQPVVVYPVTADLPPAPAEPTADRRGATVHSPDRRSDR